MCMNDDDDKCNSATVVYPHLKPAVDLPACKKFSKTCNVKSL